MLLEASLPSRHEEGGGKNVDVEHPKLKQQNGMTMKTMTMRVDRLHKNSLLIFGVVVMACLLSCGFLTGCATSNRLSSARQNKNIVILYENDVHCAVKGYSRLAGLRDAIVASDTAYVGVVSSGDFLNGGVAGSISRGQYIVDVMRNVGYDAVTLGNHEFDFGEPRMAEMVAQIKSPIICTNLFQAGASRPVYRTFIIKNYGSKRVGFVGVCTPETMTAEAYAFYDKDGNMIYDLRPDDVARLVQQSVDSARNAGADYVVLLSHLGELANGQWMDSHQLVRMTKGIDVVLDGHTHSVIPHDEVANLEGKKIGITQTGTQFANIGKLVITPKGKFTTSLIPLADISYSSARVTHTVDSITRLMSSETDRVVGRCDFELTINDNDGKRLVRKGETNLGDLCADALREAVGADIGMVNGGGIRNNIPAGAVNFGMVIGVMPFYNLTCKIEATGEMIAETLRKCTETYPNENGDFPQVAGLQFTVHVASHTVSDIMVLDRQTGQYKPLQPQEKYTIGISDYYSSGGFKGVLKPASVIQMTDEQACNTLARYIRDSLGGQIPDKYRQSQGRITILEE